MDVRELIKAQLVLEEYRGRLIWEAIFQELDRLGYKIVPK